MARVTARRRRSGACNCLSLSFRCPSAVRPPSFTAFHRRAPLFTVLPFRDPGVFEDEDGSYYIVYGTFNYYIVRRPHPPLSLPRQ